MTAVLLLGIAWMVLFTGTLAVVGLFAPKLQGVTGFLAVTAMQVFWFFALLAIASVLGI